MAVSDLSIADLELRIRIGNMMLKWLRSDDPMLTSDEYRHLVNPTIDRLTAEVREMTVACRAKKIERDGLEAEFVEHVRIGMKPGRMDLKRL